MARVWEGSRHSGTELLMLLAIADFADDQGRAYPSISTLASKCRTKPRYAIVLLEALSASGELEVRKQQGPMGRGGRTNLYRIVFDRLHLALSEVVNQGAPVNPDAVVHQGAGSSEPGFREVVNQGAPKPSGTIRTVKEARKRATAPACPTDVDPKVWSDWLTLRKAKKAPVTETVLKSARSEAGKAGMSLEAFLTVWCNRGSQGLEASWLKPADRVSRARSPMDCDHVFGSAT